MTYWTILALVLLASLGVALVNVMWSVPRLVGETKRKRNAPAGAAWAALALLEMIGAVLLSGIIGLVLALI